MFGLNLRAGDVILAVNGVDIDIITTEMLKYISYPNQEKALAVLAHRFHILRQHDRNTRMELTILRDDEVLTVDVRVRSNSFMSIRPQTTIAYELLENNIGLINPSHLLDGQLFDIMDYFANTDGLILDLRERPSHNFPSAIHLDSWFMEEPELFFRMTFPAQSTPSVFLDILRGYAGGRTLERAFHYTNNVVVLMNELTFSMPETTVMALRNAPNVTILGSNSIGGNGDILSLPLPGGISMIFSSLGVLTAEGGQTHRIGLSPDILVERTIAGIRDGRDELLEAAINFLINN